MPNFTGIAQIYDVFGANFLIQHKCWKSAKHLDKRYKLVLDGLLWLCLVGRFLIHLRKVILPVPITMVSQPGLKRNSFIWLTSKF